MFKNSFSEGNYYWPDMHLKFIILVFLVAIFKEIIGEHDGLCDDLFNEMQPKIEANTSSIIIGK